MAVEFWNTADGVSVASFEDVIKKFKTARHRYVITSNDVSNGVTAPIFFTFATPFADANYTIAQSINDLTAGGSNSNDYSPGDFHDKAGTGFNTVVYVGPGALAGEVIEINCIAIHD